MTTYLHIHDSLLYATIDGIDIKLEKGATIELPEENEMVRLWVEQGRIAPQPDTKRKKDKEISK